MMSKLSFARDVRLKKLNPVAPPFHRHSAKSKLIGRSCRVGDRVVVYQVVETTPTGEVMVTAETCFHFE